MIQKMQSCFPKIQGSAADREKIIKVLKDRDAAMVAANKAAPGFEEISAPNLGSAGLTGFFYVRQLGVTGLV
ncbi:hypothetical protein MN608_09229 [Microdochium nivale]|nr:hypothetical protein MN608_09229 [Microdochium nivale]